MAVISRAGDALAEWSGRARFGPLEGELGRIGAAIAIFCEKIYVLRK